MRPLDTDNFVAAARRHLDDATALLEADRFDGAVYLCGYVAECALKAAVQRWYPGLKPGSFSHEVEQLESAVLGEAGFAFLLALSPARRPIVLSQRLAGTDVTWMHPMRRYFANGWSEYEAMAVLTAVSETYTETIASDVLDGRLGL